MTQHALGFTSGSHMLPRVSFGGPAIGQGHSGSQVHGGDITTPIRRQKQLSPCVYDPLNLSLPHPPCASLDCTPLLS